MTNGAKNHNSPGATVTPPNLHPPREGFSRGTLQGLAVALPLMMVILIVSLMKEIRGGSGTAVTMDYLAALCAGIFIVWVIGGLFEFSGKIFDIGVKSAGGAAIVLFLAAWIRPYYNSNSFAPNNVDVTLSVGESLANFIDQVNQGRNQNTNDITFDFGGNERLIRRFRPPPLDQDLIYKGNSWIDVFKRIGEVSPCLKISMEGNKIIFQLNTKEIEEVAASNAPDASGAAKKLVVCKV